MEHVHYLVTLGKRTPDGHEERTGLFKLPATNANTREFLIAVRSLLNAAQVQRDRLVAAGLIPGTLDDLERAIQALEAACEAKVTARLDHVGATLRLRDITKQLAEQIQLIDAITRYRFGVDSTVMLTWRETKRLPAIPVKSKPQEVLQPVLQLRRSA